VTKEKFTYTAVVPRVERRTKTVPVRDVEFETRSRRENFVDYVPRQKTETVPVTTMKPVTEEKIETYEVMVPYQVQRQIQVPVCRMVPKTIKQTIAVPVAAYPDELAHPGHVPCEDDFHILDGAE
jgi:hypothetical protein